MDLEMSSKDIEPCLRTIFTNMVDHLIRNEDIVERKRPVLY